MTQLKAQAITRVVTLGAARASCVRRVAEACAWGLALALVGPLDRIVPSEGSAELPTKCRSGPPA